MLQVKKEDLGKSKVKLNIKIPSEMMRRYFSKIYNELAPSVTVKGFRKGLAPKSLTIEAIGEQKFSQEIINLALNETYIEALKQEKVIPVAPPQINIRMLKDLMIDDAELEYDAEIDLLPEIKVGDYKKIKIAKPKELTVNKDELEHVLTHLQREHAQFLDKDEPSQEGDRIEMDFEGTERGVVLENLTNKNYPVILGSKVLIPEFEEKIVGSKKGDEKEFDVKLGKEMKSPGGEKEKKEVHFKVKILDVKSVILPPLTDEFATKFQQPTMESLTKAIEEDILKQKAVEQKRQEESEIAEALLKITKIEVPESLVEQETHRMIDELQNRITMMGMPFEQYLAQIKRTESDLHADFHEQAEKTVKVGLILGEVGKLEKIDLTGEDAGKKVMERLLSYAQK